MPTCLFLVEYQSISATAGGGMALSYGHLQLLSRANVTIAVGILLGPQLAFSSEIIKNTLLENIEGKEIFLNAIYCLPFQATEESSSLALRYLNVLQDPVVFRYGDLISPARINSLEDLVSEVDPDFIWALDIIPATLAQRISTKIPVIYSHCDWKWRIKRHRMGIASKNIKNQFNLWLSKRHEEFLVKQVAGCVSGSITEMEEIRHLGAKHVAYFPTIYSLIELPKKTDLLSPPRIVHMGGMKTTANRLGLERFMDVSWPFLSKRISPFPALWIIGDLEGASRELLDAINQPHITTTGFVQNLTPILRPFDIHIIPWEYNTGTRTRIPLVLNHAQVLVSTREAALCLPELVHDQNCILVENLSDMADVITALYHDPQKRMQIALMGRDTFLNHFTKEAQYPRFDAFIATVMRMTNK